MSLRRLCVSPNSGESCLHASQLAHFWQTQVTGDILILPLDFDSLSVVRFQASIFPFHRREGNRVSVSAVPLGSGQIELPGGHP